MEKYNNLLHSYETQVPSTVIRVLKYLEEKEIWFKASRNSEAFSCKDAANKRNRLGHKGIPLRHELKSYFAKTISSSKYVAIHTRGHQTIDWEKVNQILSLDEELTKIPEEELDAVFGMEYGRVNPFLLSLDFEGTHNIQLFDKSLLSNEQPPYTMMTNAGDLTWAVEFYPEQILEVISNKVIASFVNDYDSFNYHKIGILTGNGPESGLFLWEKINYYIRTRLKNKFIGDFTFPNIVIESVPNMGITMELEAREDKSWEVVQKGIEKLCESGATLICVACNTTQYFKDKIQVICKKYGAEFVDMPSSLESYLIKNNITYFAFLGIKYVANIEEKFSAFNNLSKFNVENVSERSLQKVHDLGFEVKREGITSKNINKLRDLINNETESDVVIIALTEISIILDSQKKSKSKTKFIDTLNILAESVANKYIELTNV